MERPGWRLQVICLVAGSSAAIAHIQYGVYSANPDGTLDFSTMMVKVSVAGTLLTWITMTTVISGLIQNNYLLSDLSFISNRWICFASNLGSLWREWRQPRLWH